MSKGSFLSFYKTMKSMPNTQRYFLEPKTFKVLSLSTLALNSHSFITVTS